MVNNTPKLRPEPFRIHQVSESVGKPWPSDNRQVMKPVSGCDCSKSGGTADILSN